MRKFLHWVASYLLGVKLAGYPSAVSGRLELWLINGRKVVNAPNVNYSFDSLHRVFRRVFRSTNLQSNPPRKVLILGFGAGSVAHILHREYGWNCHITGVDLDPVMLQLAQDEFGQVPSPRLRLVTADAAEFTTFDTETYDLIVTDIFVDDSVPDAIISPHFLNNVLLRLAPDGRLYLNIMTHTDRGKKQVAQVQKILGFHNVTVLHPAADNAVLLIQR